MTQGNVLQICDYHGPYRGNFIPALEALALALRESGRKQYTAFPLEARDKGWFSDFDSQFPTLLISRKGSILAQAAQIALMVADYDISVIHCHFSKFDLPALLAAFIARRQGRHVKVVWHVHSPSKKRAGVVGRIENFLKWRVAAQFATTVHVSAGGLEVLSSRGAPKSKATVIPNGIDTKRFAGLASLGATKSRHEFLAFGWHPHIKGSDLILDAAEILFQRRQDFQVTIVGRQELADMVAQRYGTALPQWLTLKPPTDDVAQYYQQASVFISASRQEGFAYSVAEAMYLGLPVISSDISGLEWAKGSVGVVYFPSENAQALAAKMEQLLEAESATLRDYAENNRKLIASKYTLDTWTQQVIRLYGLS